VIYLQRKAVTWLVYANKLYKPRFQTQKKEGRYCSCYYLRLFLIFFYSRMKKQLPF